LPWLRLHAAIDHLFRVCRLCAVSMRPAAGRHRREESRRKGSCVPRCRRERIPSRGRSLCCTRLRQVAAVRLHLQRSRHDLRGNRLHRARPSVGARGFTRFAIVQRGPRLLLQSPDFLFDALHERAGRNKVGDPGDVAVKRPVCRRSPRAIVETPSFLR
jgi:hypothetical protein